MANPPARLDAEIAAFDRAFGRPSALPECLEPGSFDSEPDRRLGRQGVQRRGRL
jgi:hypothetical protein